MDDQSYFTVDGNEWQHQRYYKSEDHPATEDVKFIRIKTKFPVKVLLCLAVSESSISEPVFFKTGVAFNKQVNSSKCLPVLHKFIQKTPRKRKNRVLARFGVCTLRKGYVGPIRRTKNLLNPKGIKSTKRPTDTADRNF
jgi:hypothetical protein